MFTDVLGEVTDVRVIDGGSGPGRTFHSHVVEYGPVPSF